MAKVGILIVNYNGEAVQDDCIRSLYAMDEKDFEILVVDNASTDRSVFRLKESWPEVTVLEEKENLGFAAGNNAGFRYFEEQGMEYVLIMNNDTVADPALLTELLRASGGMRPAAPKILYYGTDTIWSAGGELKWNRGSAVHYGIHEKDTGQFDQEREVSFATGCCILIPMEVLKRCGVFDEAYFMYFEDTDLCARWQKAGIPIVYAPGAKLFHKISSSSGGEDSTLSTYYMYRNQLYFMKKHRESLKFPARFYCVSRAAAKYVLSFFEKKSNRMIAAAYRDYRRGITGKKPRRTEEGI